jgi:hypothetical protein
MLSSYEEELRKSREKTPKRRNIRGGEQYRGSETKNSNHIEETYSPAPEKPRGKRDGNAGGPKVKDESKERRDEPYLTFPGQTYGAPPPGPYGSGPGPGMGPGMGPGPTQGHNPNQPPGGYGPPPPPGMGMPPHYYQPYFPMYYPRKPIDAFGVTALTLGIVAMCMFWLSIIPYFFGTMMFIVIVCMTGLSIIFGAYSFGNRQRRSTHGLVGLILSIIAIILSSIIWYWSHANYDYYYIITAIYSFLIT